MGRASPGMALSVIESSWAGILPRPPRSLPRSFGRASSRALLLQTLRLLEDVVDGGAGAVDQLHRQAQGFALVAAGVAADG
ncbi:MAG: hypothetical protein D6773_10695 [Alphaproteobacteria bacterium]|nr:MAG: hypothetical protein D6773_10695 [Alphaproteobacteria bacterium]